MSFHSTNYLLIEIACYMYHVYFNSHLLDLLHEQKKSATISCESNESSLKYKDDKEISDVSLVSEEGGNIKHWTTEEDLTESIASERKTQSLADFTQGIMQCDIVYN